MERIAVLIASSPTSPSAGRAFQLIRDLSAQGHSVTLCLLEDGIYAAGVRASAYPLDRCAAWMLTLTCAGSGRMPCTSLAGPATTLTWSI